MDLTQSKRAIAVCLFIILSACIIASLTQTAGGKVEIHDLGFAGSNGNRISALLYVPESASEENPAPGILAIHGYINSRETQSGFAIEFSRRGHVVLAIDQTGHGYSSPPAFANGYGGPDGLNYLRSLPFVDKNRIGLEGHSMGGWAVLMAAQSYPDAYQAMVLAGSSTGTLGSPAGTAEFPRNLGLVFSRYDEFSEFMWGSATAPEINTTDKLQTLFGVDQTVQTGILYGNLEKGTARQLYMPAVTHAGDHLSIRAIGHAIDWFQQTIGYKTELLPGNQVWYYKEIATLVCLVFVAILVFPLSRYLLSTTWFRDLRQHAPILPQETGLQLGISIMLMTGIPIVTYFKFQAWGNQLLPANSVWPQDVTNGIMIWALGNALITLILLATKYRGLGSLKSLAGFSQADTLYKVLVKPFALAFIINLGLYAILALADGWFKIDFRFWVIALKLLSLDQAISFLAYLPAFMLFFVVLSSALHRQLDWRNESGMPASLIASMLRNMAVLSGGFVLLLMAQYLPLFSGKTMLLADQPLLTIVAIQFVPLLCFVAAVSTWLYSLKGRIFAGAFFNSIFVTWYMVAGQATQFAR
jgi:pimeloyl-ACP methyl ester carboxylesterase